MGSMSPCFHHKWKKMNWNTSGNKRRTDFCPCLERIDWPFQKSSHLNFFLSKWRTEFPPVVSAQFQKSSHLIAFRLALRLISCDFISKHFGSIAPCLSPQIEEIALLNLLWQKWAAFRPALSPTLPQILKIALLRRNILCLSPNFERSDF